MTEFRDNKPIYLQLAEQLLDDVEASVEPMSGQRLPSVREFAAKSGINANTAVRTYNWLQQEGVIYQQRGIGYFYTAEADERVRQMRRMQFFDKELPYLFDRLKAFGVSHEELAKLYADYGNDK